MQMNQTNQTATAPTTAAKFTSAGLRAVFADGLGEAAAIFAARLARKSYGARGDVRTLSVSSHAADNTFAEYSAFIGLTRGHETTGHNVHFSVSQS